MEVRQPPHQKQMQRRFTGTDGNYTVFQPTVLPQLLLSGGELIVGQTHMGKEFFSFRGQGYAPVGADKQGASQLLLQIVHAPGYIGLVVTQNRCRPGKAMLLCYMVKNTVVIVGNRHKIVLSAI